MGKENNNNSRRKVINNITQNYDFDKAVELLIENGFVVSKSEAKRICFQKGLSPKRLKEN